MYKKSSRTWLKHLDFAIFDLIILAATFITVVLFRHDFHLSQDATGLYTRLGIIMLVLYFLVAIIGQNYKSILQRNKWQECLKVFVQIVITILLIVLYMFVTKQSALFSRITFGLTGILGFIFITGERILYKHYLRMRLKNRADLPQLLIVTDKNHLDAVLEAIEHKAYNWFKVKGLALIDEERIGEEVGSSNENTKTKYEVLASKQTLKQYVLTEVVDEILIDISDEETERELTEYFLEAGITVHIRVSDIDRDLPNAIIESVGGITAITTSNNVVAPWKIIVKRITDIVGAIIGCIIVGVLYLILAPQIKAKDKGPVFFKQKRIGKNGRQFYIYKFRSMYTDAEEKKKELMAQNEMEGHMFKMENDPRVLPGIGHKMRERSLDEFPQFINVLKGDMSLVGTRPPTVEEFSHYEAHHKMRLSFKPGITGLWQVSGRSNITKFEEIVALDNEYIKNWTLRLDVKILLKTIKVVFQRVGSK